MTDIDTKQVREIRATGTQGEWKAIPVKFGPSTGVDIYSTGTPLRFVASCATQERGEPSPDAELIVHAVNMFVPMADEIDRLRGELKARDGALRESIKALELAMTLEPTRRQIDIAKAFLSCA